MFIRSVILAVFVFGLMAPAVAADEGHGRGRGSGHDDAQVTFASANAVSIILDSGRAAAGAADPNVVVTLPGASSASAAVVCSSQPSGWSAALGRTSWISPIATCTNDQATGQYRYDITFSLPSGATNLRLTGSLLSDDGVTLQLNGHGVTLSSGGGSSTPTTFDTSDQSIFQSGTNTLSFFVNNSGGPTGLDFRAQVTTPNASPRGNENDENNDNDDNHGQCVSEVAHDTAPGPGHGEAVSEAAHDCD
jgi:hypothetical protein